MVKNRDKMRKSRQKAAMERSNSVTDDSIIKTEAEELRKGYKYVIHLHYI